jgi:hypothetical protein
MLTNWRILGFTLTALAALACGCGKSADSGHSETPGTVSGNGPSQQDRAAHDAKMVVTDFLNAWRRGDEAKAKALLTEVARQKHEGQPITPPADDSVKVEVDEVSFPTPEHDIAHVLTRWIDQDEMGQPRTNRLQWVCRLESQGWRVGGFAAYVFEGEDPVFMNFEDPEDMERHRDMMNEEIKRRREQESGTRSSGESPLQADGTPKNAFQR